MFATTPTTMKGRATAMMRSPEPTNALSIATGNSGLLPVACFARLRFPSACTNPRGFMMDRGSKRRALTAQLRVTRDGTLPEGNLREGEYLDAQRLRRDAQD